MINNSNKTDTHIYNIINNPTPAFTEPCEACGVSEFQLGVRHAEERIIKLLEDYLHKLLANHGLVILPEEFQSLVRLIKGEQK